MRGHLALALGAVLVAGMAHAGNSDPALVYDLGGKHDKSFNQAAYDGAEKFKADTGAQYHDFEIQNVSQQEQALRSFARRGYAPVVAVGFPFTQALEKVAKEFPQTQFAIVDSVVNLPNVRSIVFAEHEGAYVVGVLAAMATKSNKLGFIGGMDVPFVRSFACGFKQGAHSVNPNIEFFQNMVGTSGEAWNDPVTASELAKTQFDHGVDVTYHVAGGSGIGVLQAAADAGKLGIGEDSNQDYLQPGHVLTSMVRRIDLVVYDAFKDMHDGHWSDGIRVYGLKENGVGYTYDQYNKPLISDQMHAKADDAKQKIISGDIKVHSYLTDNACPL